MFIIKLIVPLVEAVSDETVGNEIVINTHAPSYTSRAQWAICNNANGSLDAAGTTSVSNNQKDRMYEAEQLSGRKIYMHAKRPG